MTRKRLLAGLCTALIGLALIGCQRVRSAYGSGEDCGQPIATPGTDLVRTGDQSR